MEDPQVPEVVPQEPASHVSDDPENTPEVTPEEQAPENADPATPSEASPDEAPSDPEPTAAPDLPAPSEDHAAREERRLKGAVDKVAAQGEELKRMVSLQADLVRENPNVIHSIAQRDPLLANRIVEKVWGNEGILSYKQLSERIALEDIKDTNPDLYQTRKEMLELRAELRIRSEKERKIKEKTFLESKGIVQSEYDPNYQKIQEALNLIDPQVRKNDYETALEMAHAFVFKGSKPAPAKQVPTPPKVGTASPGRVIPAKQPPMSDRSAWLSKGLEELRKKKK